MGKKARERRERMVWAKNQMVRQSVISDARLIDLIKLNLDPSLNVPVIIADEVQQVFHNSSHREWTTEDFGNVSPPFDEFFIETKDKLERATGTITRISGNLFRAVDSERIAEVFHSNQPKELLEKSRWVYTIEGFVVEMSETSRLMLVMHLPGYMVGLVSERGELMRGESLGNLDVMIINAEADEFNARMGLNWTVDKYADWFLQSVYVKFLTLQLMNCRNVKLVDNEPDAEKSRIYERHFGQPLTKYKTLAIKPIGKRYESDEEQPYQGIMPLHIRRGHFATYTEDAPLFGKYTGTFWRPATVVGEQDNGIVVKDYEVKP